MRKSKHQHKLSDPIGQPEDIEIEKAKLIKELDEIIQTTESRCDGINKLLKYCHKIEEAEETEKPKSKFKKR